MISFNPADHQVHEMYKLMVGLIVPRPVALVSTVDRDGVPNVAPFSFFSSVGSNPPTVLFCPSLRASGDNRKDTLRNVEQTGEFVINLDSPDINMGRMLPLEEISGPSIFTAIQEGLRRRFA